ncbi:MAG: SCP2 sterol-binding domain-containing protein [Burkholderiales bacterium]|nr:SCP2 sterol-binding domain-containing protein [Burkholderiales bacterium]
MSPASYSTPASFTLPRPVGAVLARLPAYPGSLLLVGAINLALARHLPEDVRALLQDKRLSIRVRDARVAFDFVWRGQRFAPSAPHAQPDLAISANAQDFVLLAQRRQDPDTLFFNRRLVMEGDTELGLVVKNALDAIELPVLDPRHWAPRAVLARWAPGLADRLPPFPPFFSGRRS